MNRNISKNKTYRVVAVLGCVVALAGCHWDMWDQDRYEPLEAGAYFGEGQSASRELVAGTVPYQMPRVDTHFYEGKDGDGYATELPEGMELTRELLERGQERYNVYCIVCHGSTGAGDGMITKRGFPLPPAYHIDRLREVEIGYFVDVMTNGFGRMYSYATRIPPEDRWAIAAYVRALQLSQSATPDLLPADVLETAKNPPAPVADEEEGHGEQH